MRTDLGFTPRTSIIEEQYKSKRTDDNIAPAQVPAILLVIRNMGFPKPAVTVGDDTVSATSLQLADFLRRGADPSIPVAVQFSWTEADGSVSRVALAAQLYDRMAAGTWEGFSAVAAAVHPGEYATVYREMAIKQMQQLSDAFDEELKDIAVHGLAELQKLPIDQQLAEATK